MSSIFSTCLLVLIVLSARASSYKILAIPIALKSHIFSFATIADGLASRGHDVSLFVGETFRLNEAEAMLKNWPEVTIVRYKDSLDGVPINYDVTIDNITRTAMETGANAMTLSRAVLPKL